MNNTQSQHTPGPWRVDHSFAENAPRGHVAISGGDHIGLAAVVIEVDNEHYPEGKANAHLIAAAPELLAFAEVAAQETELCDAQDLIDRLATLRATARAVIAKAKGVPHE